MPLEIVRFFFFYIISSFSGFTESGRFAKFYSRRVTYEGTNDFIWRWLRNIKTLALEASVIFGTQTRYFCRNIFFLVFLHTGIIKSSHTQLCFPWYLRMQCAIYAGKFTATLLISCYVVAIRNRNYFTFPRLNSVINLSRKETVTLRL